MKCLHLKIKIKYEKRNPGLNVVGAVGFFQSLYWTPTSIDAGPVDPTDAG